METQSDLVSVLADVRTSLLNEAFANIQKLAWDKIHLENRSPEELVFFCIDIKTHWCLLAQLLNNDEVDQALQAPKAVTMIWGCSDASFYEFLSCVNLEDEDISFIQKTTISPGTVKYLIFEDKGVDIREVIPRNVSALQ